MSSLFKSRNYYKSYFKVRNNNKGFFKKLADLKEKIYGIMAGKFEIAKE